MHEKRGSLDLIRSGGHTLNPLPVSVIIFLRALLTGIRES
jgi:hypothetical protein